MAKSLEDTVAAYLRRTGTWTEVPGSPLLRWVDERRKLRDGGGVPAVDVAEAARRQLIYELQDADL